MNVTKCENIALKLTIKSCMNFSNVETANSRANQPICARRKRRIKFSFVTWNLIHRLNLVEVEWKFAGNTAVQSGLQVCRPVLAEDIFATCILFADTSNTWVNRLAAVDILDRCFTEKEVNILSNVEWSHKVRFWDEIERKNQFRYFRLWKIIYSVCQRFINNFSITVAEWKILLWFRF